MGRVDRHSELERVRQAAVYLSQKQIDTRLAIGFHEEQLVRLLGIEAEIKRMITDVGAELRKLTENDNALGGNIEQPKTERASQ